MTSIADLSNGPTTFTVKLGECHIVLLLQVRYVKELFAVDKISLQLKLKFNLHY
jgi:hypothetical protein